MIALKGDNCTMVVDQFNPSKIWKVYHTKCRHYYMEQWVKGYKVSKKVRTTLGHLKDIGVL